MTEPASCRPHVDGDDQPDVWTPGNVTEGVDHSTRNGRSREAADR